MRWTSAPLLALVSSALLVAAQSPSPSSSARVACGFTCHKADLKGVEVALINSDADALVCSYAQRPSNRSLTNCDPPSFVSEQFEGTCTYDAIVRAFCGPRAQLAHTARRRVRSFTTIMPTHAPTSRCASARLSASTSFKRWQTAAALPPHARKPLCLISARCVAAPGCGAAQIRHGLSRHRLASLDWTSTPFVLLGTLHRFYLAFFFALAHGLYLHFTSRIIGLYRIPLDTTA